MTPLDRQARRPSLARKKFSRRRFIFTYPSLKVLVKITAHPVFGPHLTCITFGTHRLEEMHTRRLKWRDDEHVRFDMLHAMQKSFISRSHHVNMLASALTNLQKCNNTGVILGIYDDLHCDEFRRRGHAFKTSYQEFGAALEPDVTRTLGAVSEAWEQSGYPLRGLKFCLSESSKSLRHLAHKQYIAPFLSVLEDLESLPHVEIRINVWHRHYYAKMKLISNSTRLELSRHDWDEQRRGPCELQTFNNYTYGKIGDAINRKHLETISIERSNAIDKDLIDFLRIHSASLRALEIDQLRMLVSPGVANSTLRFIRFLKDELNLTYLSLDHLIIRSVWGGPDTVSFCEEMVFEGQREVAEGLDRLIEEVSEQYWEELGKEYLEYSRYEDSSDGPSEVVDDYEVVHHSGD
ncbi:hypothetical protein E4T48_01398 [Aureobasidium sp. EXF-10727]|nr:hypothetical protein E4T48_01398 [Aureobasidium sp. EXF-10727]